MNFRPEQMEILAVTSDAWQGSRGNGWGPFFSDLLGLGFGVTGKPFAAGEKFIEGLYWAGSALFYKLGLVSRRYSQARSARDE